MTQVVQMEDEDDEAFLRKLVLPEEDRRRLYPASRLWTGGYRWFRSPNVVCLEQWRRKMRDGRATPTPSGAA